MSAGKSSLKAGENLNKKHGVSGAKVVRLC